MSENDIQTLKLREEIFNKALDGSKKSTSRLGIRDIKPGSLKLVMTEDESKFTIVEAISCKLIDFKSITDQEAILEGYKTAEELKNILIEIYGPLNEDDVLTLVEWK